MTTKKVSVKGYLRTGAKVKEFHRAGGQVSSYTRTVKATKPKAKNANPRKTRKK
jgi:hypothetical protein